MVWAKFFARIPLFMYTHAVVLGNRTLTECIHVMSTKENLFLAILVILVLYYILLRDE